MKTPEYRRASSMAKIGTKNPMYGVTRDNHPQWNPTLTDKERLKQRKYKEYDDWRKKVFERDDYTCQACYVRGGRLVGHHLNSHHWDKKSRTDINNGITLCESCHKEFHSIYGYKENDFFQFTQFQTSKALSH